MKFHPAATLLLLAKTSVFAEDSAYFVDSSFGSGFDLPRDLVATSCTGTHFDFMLEGSCTYENVLEAFTDNIFNDPISTPQSCRDAPGGAEQAFFAVLGAANKTEAKAALHAVCKGAFDSYPKTPFTEAAEKGDDLAFEQHYYNGGTDWNEEVETAYPLGSDGENTNYLKADSLSVVNFYNGPAKYSIVEWPGSLPNFDLDTCNLNSAYCCWPTDRQARDNNGNCNRPYDVNCIDKDPADNTDLCFVDMEHGVKSTGNDPGTLFFPFDGDQGEGPIHCHGLAWSDDPNHPFSVYKGNVLFYVSMYDHMNQRGYVRNVPGAPMCACTEQMPAVSRSDCTEIGVERETFEFGYNGVLKATLKDLKVRFNSCQGINDIGQSDGNDLWPHVNKLYREGEVTAETTATLRDTIIGEIGVTCDDGTREYMSTKGYKYSHDETGWVQVAGREEFLSPAVGNLMFDDLLDKSPNKIVKRICPGCVDTHQQIYAKILNNTIDTLFEWFIMNRDSKLMVYGTDFKIYSTYEDAKNGVNEWTSDYDAGQIFPGNSGPTVKVNNQFSDFRAHSRHQKNVAYYVEEPADGYTITPQDNVEQVGKPQCHDNVIRNGQCGPAAYLDSNGDITLSTWGKNIAWNDDSFTFMHMKADGDTTLEVKILAFDHRSGSSKAGIMIRESLHQKSKNVAAYIREKGFGITSRSSYGGRSWEQGHGGSVDYSTQGVTLRLRKKDHVFHASRSLDDGVTWTDIGNPVTVDFDSASFYVGLVVTSQSHERIGSAKFQTFAADTHICTSTRSIYGAGAPIVRKLLPFQDPYEF